MSVQVEIMEELSELCGIDRIGVLSPEAPYSLSFAGGKEIKKYLNGTALQTMNVQILGRDGAASSSFSNRSIRSSSRLWFACELRIPPSGYWSPSSAVTLNTSDDSSWDFFTEMFLSVVVIEEVIFYGV